MRAMLGFQERLRIGGGRHCGAGPADFALQRAVAQPTIAYRQSIDGLQPEGAPPAAAG